MQLVVPAAEHLPSYTAALERGWSPDNVRGADATVEELQRIREDASAFLASKIDREAKGGPITLLDGTKAERLPGIHLWIWDGEFCGSVGFRWRPGTEALPPTCLGHIGYAVVPWKRNRGCATFGLAAMLPHARAEGLRYVELTTDVDNVPSQRTIERNGGVLVERFQKPEGLGGGAGLRYRISLG